MPLIHSVEVRYLPRTDVRIVLDGPTLALCDTCSFEVGPDDDSGAGLNVRIERGLVVDAHVWDPYRRRRHQLGAGAVLVSGRELTCAIPATLVSRIRGRRCLTARLLVNGMLVQSRFPVLVDEPASTPRVVHAS